jgi:phage terminase small subunit
VPRARNPDREKAEEIYLKHKGNIELVKIAEMLGRPPGTIRGWKNKDKWDDKLNGTFQKNETKNTERSKKKKGGQPGNKNAVGHGAPPKNKNAEKHGFFSKYLPEETMDIIQEIKEKDPLDILWENIQIQYAAIIRAQKIMYVRDINDKTVEKVEERRGKIKGERWEVQQAWDKQSTFLQAQSRAMAELRNMIKQYDELLNTNRELATEEQKLRIEKLKAEISSIKGDSEKTQDAIKDFIEATTIPPDEVKELFEGEDDADIQE